MNFTQTLATLIFIGALFFLIYSFAPKKIIVTSKKQFLEEIEKNPYTEKTLHMVNGLYIDSGEHITVPPNITMEFPEGTELGGNSGGSISIFRARK